MLLEDDEKDFEPSPYASLNLEFELLSDGQKKQARNKEVQLEISEQ